MKKKKSKFDKYEEYLEWCEELDIKSCDFIIFTIACYNETKRLIKQANIDRKNLNESLSLAYKNRLSNIIKGRILC
jgi:hypothetical protein